MICRRGKKIQRQYKNLFVAAGFIPSCPYGLACAWALTIHVQTGISLDRLVHLPVGNSPASCFVRSWSWLTWKLCMPCADWRLGGGPPGAKTFRKLGSGCGSVIPWPAPGRAILFAIRPHSGRHRRPGHRLAVTGWRSPTKIIGLNKANVDYQVSRSGPSAFFLAFLFVWVIANWVGFVLGSPGVGEHKSVQAKDSWPCWLPINPPSSLWVLEAHCCVNMFLHTTGPLLGSWRGLRPDRLSGIIFPVTLGNIWWGRHGVHRHALYSTHRFTHQQCGCRLKHDEKRLEREWAASFGAR